MWKCVSVVPRLMVFEGNYGTFLVGFLYARYRCTGLELSVDRFYFLIMINVPSFQCVIVGMPANDFIKEGESFFCLSRIVAPDWLYKYLNWTLKGLVIRNIFWPLRFLEEQTGTTESDGHQSKINNRPSLFPVDEQSHSGLVFSPVGTLFITIFKKGNSFVLTVLHK